jgi:hypothetical protein
VFGRHSRLEQLAGALGVARESLPLGVLVGTPSPPPVAVSSPP